MKDIEEKDKKYKIMITIIVALMVIALIVCTIGIIHIVKSKNNDKNKVAETTTEPTTEQVTTEETTTEEVTTEQETTAKASQNIEAVNKDDFKSASDTVTAKDKVNIRSTPDQGNSENIVGTLKNGETVSRTGTNDKGWSRVVYNGNVCYAVSNYLTTDLSYTAPTDDGFDQVFTSCNEQVTAKKLTNLRTIPSTTREDSKVIYQLKNGEYVQRTGISDKGFSRVIYNGQTLYCLTSYLVAK